MKTPERNDPCPCGSGKKFKKCCGAETSGSSRMAVDPHQNALDAFHRGAFQEAQSQCVKLLQDHPIHPDAIHLCGLVSYRLGRLTEAQDRLLQASQAAPQNAFIYGNLCLVLRDAGELTAAAECARRALALDPSLPDAHNNLGTVRKEQGDLREAEACFRRALALDAGSALFLTNLAALLLETDAQQEAEQYFRRALMAEPRSIPALTGLGTLCVRQERWTEAHTFLEQALAEGAGDATLFNNLGLAWHGLNNHPAAVYAYQQALARAPALAGVYYNLGRAYEDLGRKREAFTAYERAVDLGHATESALWAFVHSASLVGAVDKAYTLARGLLKDSRISLRLLSGVISILGQAADFEARADTWKKILSRVASADLDEETLEGLLLSSTYESSLKEEEVIRLHRSWGERVERRTASDVLTTSSTQMQPGRLRIAYLSPDFRKHSVGLFIQHVIAQHDHSAFEIFCYSLTRNEDGLSQSIRQHADHFIEVADLDENSLARRIQADGINILIDLAGHSANNRLCVLARRPAPLQLTWIGYLHTTGLAAVDYRVTDTHADDPLVPRGTEALLALPESFLCFGSFPEIRIEPAPACARKKYVTFASFNNLMKFTAEAVHVWARVLAAVPDSKLLIMTTGASSTTVQTNLSTWFARDGIGAERLVFRDAVPHQEYFRLHNEVDIVLDTFPFNGGTVTASALWMGVPVVTLAGTSHRQRVGYSMLKNIDTEETVAWSKDEYVEIAARLARDPARLSRLRLDIAARVRASVLCDPSRFTRQLEAGLQRIWDNYCAQHGLPSAVSH